MHLADRVCLHGLGLAFDIERFQRLGGEQRARLLQRLGSGIYPAGCRGRHQTGREVDRVAHDRERPSDRSADLAREHVPTIHPDTNGKRVVPLDDRARGAQYPSLVVVPGGRNPRNHNDLATVGVDVGSQERDLLLIDRLLHTRNDLVQRGGGRVAAVFREEVVDALELDESDARDAVHGLAAAFVQVLA